MPAGSKPGKVRGQREVQRIGTIVAAGVGVVFLGVLGWYVVRGGGRSTKGAPVTRPEGLKGRPSNLAMSDSGELQLNEGERFDIPVMDKKDPRRQMGLLTFEKFEPREAHHYEATKPDAWLYLDGGRSLHITAAAGSLYMPDRQKEPESGTLSGGVVARLYEPKADGSKIDEAKDAPFLTFETKSLIFDATLGKGSTTDIVTIKSDIVDCTVHGLDLLFNQVRERLELCRIGAGDNVAVFHSDRARRKPAETKTVAQKTTDVAPTPVQPAPAGARPAVAKAPPETLYRVDVEQTVEVSQGGRKLNADLLQLWARLVGNKLPDGAIAEIKAQAEPAAAPAPVKPSGAPVAAAPTHATNPAGTAAPATREITLRWQGPCVIAPLEQAPPELKTEHLAARFTAEKAGAVALSDSEKGASGHAGSIEYGATTGTLLLAGKDAGRPTLTFPNLGTVATGRIEGDLVHGLIHIPVAGELKDEKRDASAAWTKQADFTLAVRDGQLTGELTRAMLDGGAELRRKDGSAAADSLRADFATTAGQANLLSRVVLDGHASASQKDSSLTAGLIDATFGPPATKGGDPEPRVVTATGDVVAKQRDSTLKTGWLEARLARSPEGKVDVVSAAAKGDVRFTQDHRQIVATADEMNADLSWEGLPKGAPHRQTIDLLGKHVAISQEDKSSITGTQVRLNGVDRSVFVFSGGTFQSNDPAKKAVVTARWTESMSYNETAGMLDAVGDVFAVSTPDALRRDEIEAWRVKLALRPRSEASESDPATKVLGAEAIGSILEREGGTNARITSERFVADGQDGKRREQLQYIEGARILADDVKGTADVPGAGKLVYVNNGADRAPADSSGRPAIASGDARGDSLFTWTRSLHMDRPSGKADLDGDVRMTHRSLVDRQITNLDCTHLTAIGFGEGVGTPQEGRKAGLRSATATGAVFVTQGPEAAPNEARRPRKELVADKVDYDAVKETLEATASTGGLVTFLDPEKGAPVSASGLFWDLASGRIEARGVSPIVAPKGAGSK